MDEITSRKPLAEASAKLEPYIHPNALVDEGAIIGRGTRIWAFAHILSGALIGEDCNICDHTFVEGGVTIGDRVTAKCGVYIWEGITVEDDVFIGPAAVFTNDLMPRSKQYPEMFTKTHLKKGCSIGANATVLPGVTIGSWSLVGAGSVVTKDVPDYGVVWGNQAQFQYWICRCTRRMDFVLSKRYSCDCGEVYALDTEMHDVKLCR